AVARLGQAGDARDGRDQGDGSRRDLPRRLPDDDLRRHVHHQRRRARRRLPARPLPGRLLLPRRGPGDRQAGHHRQTDPEPRRLAGVRDVEPRHPLGQGRPQAEDAGHDPAPGDRDRDRRAADRNLRRRGYEPRPALHADHPRQGHGHRQDPRSGDHRTLPAPAPRRSADPRQRDQPVGEPVFQRAALRPGPRRPLQTQRALAQAPRRRRRRSRIALPEPHPHPGRPDRDHPRDDPAQQRPQRTRRHRPPRQPPHPRRRRIDPDARPDRLPTPGARHPGADDDPGPGDRDPERPDLDHPAGDGGGARVLRRIAVVPVHGPDQSAGGADPQTAPLGAGTGRAVPRPGRVRRARRPPVPLRPDLPDRDPGRAEHRPDRQPGDLRQDQPVRLHRDAVPPGDLDPARRRPGDLAGRSSPARRGGPPGNGNRGRQEGRGDHRCGVREDQGRRNQVDPDQAGRVRADRLPLRRPRRAGDDRPGEHAARRQGALHPRPGDRPRRRWPPLPGGAGGAGPLYGRVAEAGRLRRHRPDPVPGARRRQPRLDGRQHAAPGGAAGPAPGAGHRHRGRVPGGAGLRPGAGLPPRRDRDRGLRAPDQDRGRRRDDSHLQPAEVRALEPGHLHQPATERYARHPGRDQRHHRRLVLDRERRAGAGSERAGRVHALGRRQLRGRDPDLGALGPRRRLHLDPHREVRDRSPRHQARAGRDHPRHPQRGRGKPGQPRRERDHPDRGRSPAERHPGRQGDAPRRNRTLGGRTPAAGHLRREGTRGERHLASRAARGPRQDHRRQAVPPRRRLGPRAAGRRQRDGPRPDRPEAQDLRGRQDGRAPRQQGRHLPHPADGRHAVPAGRAAGRHHPQPDRRAEPDEPRSGAGNAPRLGGGADGVPGRDARLRRRQRGADPGRPRRCRLARGRQGRPLRRAHGRKVRSPGHGRHHLHAEAGPPGRGQDPRPLDRPLLPGHPAAVGRQGPVRRPAVRRDGGVGAGSLRRGAHPPRDADRQVRRHGRPGQNLRGDRQGRGDRRGRRAGKLQGPRQGAALPRTLDRRHQPGRANGRLHRGHLARPAFQPGPDQPERFRADGRL
ncbi:MAG: DNA-directed RNA polymerase beta subunit, partial [uncultured Thermomicrobiales bacterium]